MEKINDKPKSNNVKEKLSKTTKLNVISSNKKAETPIKVNTNKIVSTNASKKPQKENLNNTINFASSNNVNQINNNEENKVDQPNITKKIVVESLSSQAKVPPKTPQAKVPSKINTFTNTSQPKVSEKRISQTKIPEKKNSQPKIQEKKTSQPKVPEKKTSSQPKVPVKSSQPKVTITPSVTSKNKSKTPVNNINSISLKITFDKASNVKMGKRKLGLLPQNLFHEILSFISDKDYYKISIIKNKQICSYILKNPNLFINEGLKDTKVIFFDSQLSPEVYNINKFNDILRHKFTAYYKLTKMERGDINSFYDNFDQQFSVVNILNKQISYNKNALKYKLNLNNYCRLLAKVNWCNENEFNFPKIKLDIVIEILQKFSSELGKAIVNYIFQGKIYPKCKLCKEGSETQINKLNLHYCPECESYHLDYETTTEATGNGKITFTCMHCKFSYVREWE